MKKKKDNEITHKDIQLIKNNQLESGIYPELFPVARSIKRNIILYIGPTNSGKTYNAINKLVSFKSGCYLAPLRLLALEGQDEIRARGHECSFITGEEKDIIQDASFIAQTVETFNYNKITECVMIDEVQMIADESRGWAWTQALIGAPAKNIVLTGSLDCRSRIQEIAKMLGDNLEIVELQRFTKMIIEDKPFNIQDNVHEIEPGTAIVTFSRKNVLAYKQLFESEGIDVSVIYGNLSPEVRRDQAKRFRDGVTKILISTDAIAMGLNLPIKRVIFSEVTKFDGKNDIFISSPEVRQIAGRAGRYGKYEEGFVTAQDAIGLHYIKEKMESMSNIPKKLYIKPTIQQIKYISSLLNSKSIVKILFAFKKMIKEQDNIFYCFNYDHIKDMLEILDSFSELSLEDKLFFAEIPMDGSNNDFLNIYKKWIQNYVKNNSIIPLNYFKYNEKILDKDSLLKSENNIKMLTAYMYLSNHLPLFALEKETAIKLKKKNNEYIVNCLLEKIDTRAKCVNCQNPLPIGFVHKKCENCYFKNEEYDFNFDIE